MSFFRNGKQLAERSSLVAGLLIIGCSSDDGSPAGDPMGPGTGGAAETGGQSGASGSGATGGVVGSSGGSVGSGGASSGGTGSGGVAGAGSGGAATGGAAGSGGAGGAAGAGGTAHQFSIEFDSTLDTTGWFDPPEVKAALAAGAAMWTRRIRDDFEEIPIGTPIQIRNLDKVDDTYIQLVTQTPIDDLRVYVACSDVLDSLGVLGRTRRTALFPGDQGIAFQQRLQERWTGPDQEPWAVGIAIGCHSNFFIDTSPDTDNDLPPNQPDFITLIAHELGHALGIGGSQTYLALVSTAGTEFLGTNAVALFGGPVPLESDSGHLLSKLMFNGGPVLMDPSMTVGTRLPPTPLDFAILSDIGYELAP